MKLKVAVDGNDYLVDVEVLEDDGVAPGYVPPHGPHTAVQPITIVTPPAASLAGESVADEAKVCRSPVAGVVVKVNVRAGQQLQPNDLIMVLEAMKMETNITAPVAGKIAKINAGEGDGVKINQVLVEFE